jgi:hypothetical protein
MLRFPPFGVGKWATKSGHWLHSLFFICSAFLVSRAMLEVIGLIAVEFIRPHLDFEHVWNYSGKPWLNLWGVWDTGWYLTIANDGYDLSRRVGGPIANQANWAFFPAYPLLCRAIANLLGAPVFAVMVLVSNLFFLAALGLVWRITAAEFGDAAARAAVLLLCFMPGSYVFSSAYPEAMFLLLMAATLVLVRRQRWLLAGGTAAIAAVTRNVGIGLLLYIVCALYSERARLALHVRAMATRPAEAALELAPIALGLALPILALAGYCAFLWHWVGDPLAFMSVMGGWKRHFQVPLLPLLFPVGDTGFARNPLNYVVALLAIGLLVELAARRRWPLFALGLFLVTIPLTGGLESYVRYSICMLPSVMAAGALCARHATAAALALPVLALANGLMMTGWSLGFAFTW